MLNTKKLAVMVLVLAMAVVAAGCARKGTKTSGSTSGLQKIHFDFDKYNIKSEEGVILKSNAQWIQGSKKSSVVIEGHCDERGTTEYNVALGDRRAKSAKSYLVNLGVSADKLATISYGKERPIATCHDESCWQQNRRDEFIAK